MTANLGFGLNGVHIKGIFLSKNVTHMRRRGRRRRRRDGAGEYEEDKGKYEHTLGDATLPFSRTLAHPLRCNGTRRKVIRGRKVTWVMP